jgi:hypothetical protein
MQRVTADPGIYDLDIVPAHSQHGFQPSRECVLTAHAEAGCIAVAESHDENRARVRSGSEQQRAQYDQASKQSPWRDHGGCCLKLVDRFEAVALSHPISKMRAESAYIGARMVNHVWLIKFECAVKRHCSGCFRPRRVH